MSVAREQEIIVILQLFVVELGGLLLTLLEGVTLSVFKSWAFSAINH